MGGQAWLVQAKAVGGQVREGPWAGAPGTHAWLFVSPMGAGERKGLAGLGLSVGAAGCFLRHLPPWPLRGVRAPYQRRMHPKVDCSAPSPARGAPVRTVGCGGPRLGLTSVPPALPCCQIAKQQQQLIQQQHKINLLQQQIQVGWGGQRPRG